ncbi:LysR family transcriptional regulator [Jannaschia rubra]|uniref:Cyn operon transcriptional activator n=1 Tax=Jannaschia rubra TaxID=282197 RepID=A0A0M6XMS9_9RHOB|nr:LysR family transcriptional regulator [Jannaschia rubra]CTQ31334.1 Cyn operon transcriptional activator [Jannaschia rubra]SFF81459.1 DNA-binding transcriptional regulator, LysR family [Jannaschia rubra]
MAIKLEMLRVFRVVAEQGTLAAGARLLGRTPSAISMTLAQIEDEIGAPLFETDRKSRLTPLGQLVLEESRRATDIFDRSAEAIRRHAISTAGIVRIAAVPSATVSLLPAVIEAFQTAHSDVRIEISDVDSVAVRRRVQRDEADIGIISARPDDPSEGELIRCDDLGIVCAEGGPVHAAHLAEGGRSGWGLLALERLIANPLCHLIDDPDVHALLAASTLEARNTTAILSFVRRGLGASILPFDAVRSQPEGVEFFVPSHPVGRRELRRIRQKSDRPGAQVEAFWDLLRRPFPTL